MGPEEAGIETPLVTKNSFQRIKGQARHPRNEENYPILELRGDDRKGRMELGSQVKRCDRAWGAKERKVLPRSERPKEMEAHWRKKTENRLWKSF